jgi:hypothetical protein
MSKLDAIVSNVNFGKFIDFGYTAIWALVFIVVVVVVAYFVLIILKYKHKVRVLEVVGDAVQERPDKGALLKDRNTKKAYQFKLLKSKAVLPPFPADSCVFDKRGKKVVYIAQTSPTDFTYIKPNKNVALNEIELIPIPQDQLFWMANMIERDGEKYSKELKWYQNPAIMFWGTLGVTLVILILTFKFAGATWTTAQATAKSTSMEIINVAKSSIGQVVT